jgi:hypothetical protein
VETYHKQILERRFTCQRQPPRGFNWLPLMTFARRVNGNDGGRWRGVFRGNSHVALFVCVCVSARACMCVRGAGGGGRLREIACVLAHACEWSLTCFAALFCFRGMVYKERFESAWPDLNISFFL